MELHSFSYSNSEYKLRQEIGEFVNQPHYPCVAAVKAFHSGEIRTGIYRDFGTAFAPEVLRKNLAVFLDEFLTTKSVYLTYWATFDGRTDFSEGEFETRLWNELSHLTSEKQKVSDWGAHNSNPAEASFSFCLFGEPFFVVGLHPCSSRRSRKFQRPSLIFNLFSQFGLLEQQGAYQPMVDANRRRDKKFDGMVNPMAERHAEKWESIQFSGKSNPPDWRCPFRFRG